MSRWFTDVAVRLPGSGGGLAAASIFRVTTPLGAVDREGRERRRRPG
ncbi:hypothetical protein ACFOLD_06680 [Kocuria carniphila]